MDSYLAKFGLTYDEWIRPRYIYGRETPYEWEPTVDDRRARSQIYASNVFHKVHVAAKLEPANSQVGANMFERLALCQDIEERPARLSYLLGYEVSYRTELELQLSALDREIHFCHDLNEICILFLAGYDVAIPNRYQEKFDYVIKIANGS